MTSMTDPAALPEPMSDERLAEIRGQNQYWMPAIAELLADNARLRAALADARAIGAAVDQYDAETALVPIGAENRSKGGSVYNWRRTVVDEIRKKADALRAAPQAPAVRVPVELQVGQAVCAAEDCEYPEWRGRNLWVCGVNYDVDQKRLNYWVSENWPPKDRGDVTDGWEAHELVALPNHPAGGA